MKKSTLILLLFLPSFLFSQNIKKVIIIGMDGCRSDALHEANTPNIDNLISNGIFSPDALNDDITISGPGWSAILCGVGSDKHLVTNNDFSGNNYSVYPSFFKYLNDYDSMINTLSICHWGPINDFIVQNHADFKLNVSSDLEVANQAAAYISSNDPDAIFLHFDDIDHAGHSYGFSPNVAEYMTAIENVDTHIGTVIQSIEQRSSYSDEDWLILVTTDHGGLGTSHGGISFEEQRIFVVASGNSIIPEVILKDSMIISENVQNCLGDSIELKFDGIDDNVQVLPNSIFDFDADKDFTIECRVRTNTAADIAIVGNKDWDSGNNKGFVFSFKFPSGPEWKVNIGDGNNRADIDTGGSIADNEWHTLSVTFDRDGFMKMFQDGVIIDSTDISAVGDISTNEGLFFGTDINQGYDFSGSIAEVRVWNTVLNEQAIEDWQCLSIDNNHPNFNNLIGYWKINEGMGNVQVTDYSINGNDGNINEAEWTIPDSIVVYDFSVTPRLTGIVPTLFTHLCVPIQTDWNLDGTSLIPECIMTNVENELSPEIDFKIFPNPTNHQVLIQLQNINLNHSIQLEVFNSIGKKLHEQTITTNEVQLDISNFPKGEYFITVRMDENKFITKKLILFSNK